MKFTSKRICLLSSAVWLILVTWQVIEHRWIRASAHAFLQNRAEDISNALAVVLRSQRRFGGAIIQYRLESALDELVHSDELQSIVLLNSSIDIVAKSGELSIPMNNTLVETGVAWGDQTVAFMNMVDLSVSADLNEDPNEPPMVVIPITEEEENEFRERRRPPPRFDSNDHDSNAPDSNNPDIPSSSEQMRLQTDDPENDSHRRNDESWRRRSFRGPPPGMTREEFEDFLKQQRLHSFIIELSTQNYTQTCNRDLWLRFFIMGFGTVAIAGGVMAWRNVKKTSELQMRLVRASEMNSHLREMNLAAAGLAHETRNPLNLVRGMAHLIFKDHQSTPTIRNQSQKITEEVDRITAQLNEFINYSKPREPKPANLLLNKLILDIHQTLASDILDKQIVFSLVGEEVHIEADESLLRQMMFNLILNAIQAVSTGGKITISVLCPAKDTVTIECKDDGPGIPQDLHAKVFQPYFTTHESGTGLGLTVVQQIALAHGWYIECLPAVHGTIFQIRGILRVYPHGSSM